MFFVADAKKREEVLQMHAVPQLTGATGAFSLILTPTFLSLLCLLTLFYTPRLSWAPLGLGNSFCSRYACAFSGRGGWIYVDRPVT